VPRGRMNHWMKRGQRFSRRRFNGFPGASQLDRALAVARQRDDIVLLHDTSRRFDQFRAGLSLSA